MPRQPIQTALSFVARIVRLCGRCHIPRAAAALAYFFVLSFFPLLLCVSSFVGLVRLDALTLLDSLDRVLPPQALELARDYVLYVSEHPSPALLLAGGSAIVLSASAGLRVLLDTMDEMFDHPRDTGVRRIALSVFYSLLALVTVYLSIVVILTGDWFLHWLSGVVTLPLDLTAVSGLWRWLRYLLLFCFMMLLVLAVYRVGTPRGRVPFLPMLASALLCAVSLVAASGLFSRFIALSSRYSLLYGSLASIIILLVWLYLCGMILLIGAVFLRVWTKNHPGP